MNVQLPVTLCARQPIFDSNLDVYAYELFCRDADVQQLPGGQTASVSGQVIYNAFMGLPFENLLEGKKGFIRLPETLLKNPPPLSESNVVIELHADLGVDDASLEDIHNLKAAGFTIALDGFDAEGDCRELLALSDIIKLDIQSKPWPSMLAELDLLSHYTGILLADNIVTTESFEQCQGIGFTLFQGCFLSMPNIVKGKTLDGDQASVVRLLKVLQREDAGFDDIEAVIASSPTITFKLLKLINSAAFSFRTSITSVQKALTMLGLDKVRAWGSLMALTEMSDKPKIICMNALIRAQMCKLLAQELLSTPARIDSLFTLGLLSTMEMFLDISMAEVVKLLELPEWMGAALVNRSGNAGLILSTVIAYETCDFDAVDWQSLKAIGLGEREVQSAYQVGIIWAAGLVDELMS